MISPEMRFPLTPRLRCMILYTEHVCSSELPISDNVAMAGDNMGAIHGCNANEGILSFL